MSISKAITQRALPPDNREFKEMESFSTWATKLSSIHCEEIGIANTNQERGVILASFNAG